MNPKKKIEEVLRELPEPDAPRELAEKIKREIPRTWPELQPAVSRRHPASLLWRTAAVIALVAAGGYAALRLTPGRKEPVPSVEPRVAVARPAPTAAPARAPSARLQPPAAAAPAPPPPVSSQRPAVAGPSRPALVEGKVMDRSEPKVGSKENKRFTLDLSTVVESVTVSGEAPVLDKTQTNVTASYSVAPAGSAGAIEGGYAASPKPVAAGERNFTFYASPSFRPPSTYASPSVQPPSTGGTREPNDAPYGSVFFKHYGVNPFVDTDEDRFSTFGLEVDTGSYTIVRRHLRDGSLPPAEAVRVEELLNSFDYGDPPPSRGDFSVRAEGAPTPFGSGSLYRVLRFGIRGRVVDPKDRKPAVLTFVVDVSGSMAYENRLELVKKTLGVLLDQLRPTDQIGLAVYGSNGHRLLDHTSDKEAIRVAINRLAPEGSTNAEEGLAIAYEMASSAFRRDAINRVILCSDGVANVGRTGPESILEAIARKAKQGIELTTVGFGMGNYNDVLMEQLADKGNGRYAYVDTLEEARRIFVENLTGTLQTIASDTKVQVEFHPETVSRYRLIGYENRDIADEKFRDDSVDAGEIGAGHSVTALYEIKLQPHAGRRDTVATLRMRYLSKETGRVVETEHPVTLGGLAESWESAPRGVKLAAVVAEFGEVLKASYWAKGSDLDTVLRRAQAVSAQFPGNPRVAEFAGLAGAAARLKGPEKAASPGEPPE